MSPSSWFLMVTGIVLSLLALITLATAFPGTALFYVSTAELLFGIFAILGTFYLHFRTPDPYLQQLPLPQAQSVEEYLALLDLNEENRYGLALPDLLSSYQGIDRRESLHQTRLDLPRGMICLLNGEPFPLSECFDEEVFELTQNHPLTQQIVRLAAREKDPFHFKSKLEEIAPLYADSISSLYLEYRTSSVLRLAPFHARPLLNQAIFSDLIGPLSGRYQNERLNIYLGQRSSNYPSSSILIDIVQEEGACYIYYRLQCQINFLNNEHPPVHFIGQLKVDLDEGDGKLTWQSPRREIQPFFSC